MCFRVGSFAYGAEDDDSAMGRHNRLVETVERKATGAVPTLIQAVEDEKEVVRRTAAHLLVALGAEARPGLEAALRSPHVDVRHIVIKGLDELGLVEAFWPAILRDDAPVIRRYAQLVLMKKYPQPDGAAMDRLVSELEDAYRGGDAEERRQVVQVLASFEELAPACRRLVKQATQDEETEIRKQAYKVILDQVEPGWDEAADLLESALSDPAESIRDIGSEMRWKLLEVKQVRFPREGWRFRIDPDDVGREQGWYKPEWDDGDWRGDVPIEDSWKTYMSELYNGIGWYRRSIHVPETGEGNRMYLHFEGVDEEAWVWVNGTYVGEHAMGQEGWNVPFVLDVTEAVKPGAENQITVRAKNTSGGAGIWRPVRLRFLNTEALE